jgi:plastocyanin
MLRCCKKIINLNLRICLLGILAGSFLPLAFLNSCASGPEKRVPETHTIVISAMQFSPAELTLQRGDTVIFLNKDLVVHDITQLPDKSWSSSNLSPGQSFRMAVGSSTDYYCSIHPTMKGRLLVQP